MNKEELSDKVKTIIGQAIGQASMCWQFPHRAGIFQSDAACMITDQVMRDIKEHGMVAATVEIDRLSTFIMTNFQFEIGLGNPREGESAVDVAIRLLTGLLPKFEKPPVRFYDGPCEHVETKQYNSTEITCCACGTIMDPFHWKQDRELQAKGK